MRSLRRPLFPLRVRSLRGLNLSGLEFSHNTLPGTAYTHYDAHQESNYTWAASKGFNVVRLPVLWERIQPTVGGALSNGHKAYIDQNIAWASSHGLRVIIDIHNYGGRRVAGDDHKIGDGTLTNEHFCNLWQRLAFAYRDEPTVAAYDIMNEPSNMPVPTNSSNHLSATWTVAAQDCINAIREIDPNKPIIVETDNFSGLQNIRSHYGDEPWWFDPADRLHYSCHLYIDSANSGAYNGSNASFAGAGRSVYYAGDLLAAVGRWCRTKGVKLFIGEFGVPDNEEAWLSAAHDFYMVAHQYSDVVTGITYWAYGDWYNAITTVQPSNGTDRGTMQIIGNHLPV